MRAYHAFQDFAEDNMLPIEPRRLDGGDEELGPICILPSIGHTQPAWAIMFQFEIFVRKTASKYALSFRKIEQLSH